MSAAIRIEAVGFLDHYCAVYRRPGERDEFLVDGEGNRRRFETAAAAIYAARSAIGIGSRSMEPKALAEEAAAWKRRKDAAPKDPFRLKLSDIGASSAVEVVRKKRRKVRAP